MTVDTGSNHEIHGIVRPLMNKRSTYPICTSLVINPPWKNVGKLVIVRSPETHAIAKAINPKPRKLA